MYIPKHHDSTAEGERLCAGCLWGLKVSVRKRMQDEAGFFSGQHETRYF